MIRQKGKVKGGMPADRPAAADESRTKGVTATPIAASRRAAERGDQERAAQGHGHQDVVEAVAVEKGTGDRADHQALDQHAQVIAHHGQQEQDPRVVQDQQADQQADRHAGGEEQAAEGLEEAGQPDGQAQVGGQQRGERGQRRASTR